MDVVETICKCNSDPSVGLVQPEAISQPIMLQTSATNLFHRISHFLAKSENADQFLIKKNTD